MRLIQIVGTADRPEDKADAIRDIVEAAVDELLNDREALGYNDPGAMRGIISARNRILRALQ